MFLTDDNLKQLTGKERPSAQARWLESHGWLYTLSAEGRVIVHEREAERQLCGKAIARRTEPDLEALRERM